MPRKDDDYFSLIPIDVLREILKFSKGEDIAKLPQLSCTFYNTLKSSELWRNKFIEAGLRPDIFQLVEGKLSEYTKFYRFFLRIAQQKPRSLSELITSLVKNYLDYCFKQCKGPSFVIYNNGIENIDKLYNEKPTDEQDGFAKQMMDVISQLIRVDAKQREKAYGEYYSNYKVFVGPH